MRDFILQGSNVFVAVSVSVCVRARACARVCVCVCAKYLKNLWMDFDKIFV